MGAARILLVDDDAVSRELLALLLEREGYTVASADSGDAALEHLTVLGGSLPDVVLTDVQMPGTSGIELGRRMRALCGRASVLLSMSGSSVDETIRKEFDGSLRKPFTMETLKAAIRDGSATGEGYAPSSAVALDEGVYRKLATAMPRERLRQLYMLCLDDAKNRIPMMRRAASERDDASYKREAHAIKGGCGMVGAMELQTLATSMEERGLEDTNHLASLDEFITACERLRRMLIARVDEGAEELSGEDAP